MIDEIEHLLENDETINTAQKINETQDIDFEDIENIELED